jgi:hypothetical protein
VECKGEAEGFSDKVQNLMSPGLDGIDQDKTTLLINKQYDDIFRMKSVYRKPPDLPGIFVAAASASLRVELQCPLSQRSLQHETRC